MLLSHLLSFLFGIEKIMTTHYITQSESSIDLQDLIIKPRYLVCFTVGYEQKNNIDAAVKKVRLNSSLALFPSTHSFEPWTCPFRGSFDCE